MATHSIGLVDIDTYHGHPHEQNKKEDNVERSAADRGILICGSGIGVCVAANKMPGIRAGICHDTYSGHQGVEHDDMNVLVMGSRIVGSALAGEITRAYLAARFDKTEERFVRRLNKTKAMELRYMRGAAT